MRKNLIAALLTTAVYLLTACNKEEEIYYSALGIIRISEDSIVIETDNGNRLLVDDRNRIGIPLVDNDRVIAYFTLVDRTAPAGIDLVIDIYDISKVLFKPVIELSSAIADSIGDDPLTVGSLWLDKDFINLSFIYYGGEKMHYINLIRHPGEIRTDTIDLEIRHNDNDDAGIYSYSGFVSFDLSSLQNEVYDSVVLRIKAREFNNQTFRENFIYTW
jgi:hypothetical protein